MERYPSTIYSRVGSSPNGRQTEQKPEPTSFEPLLSSTSDTGGHLNSDRADEQMKHNIQALSLNLSHILDNIGLSEKAVSIRRQETLKSEKIQQIGSDLTANNICLYDLGSQTEASTTPGLHSDHDRLHCPKNIYAIQDIKEWKKGQLNLLILQGGDIPAGYCRLQLLRSDKPLPETETREGVVSDREGRLLYKNNNHLKWDLLDESTVHGPARTIYKHGRELDIVASFRCKSMSKQVMPALERFRNKQWPTAKMLKTARESGFFLVCVGHRLSDTRDLEWRVSPSLTERCLMLGLNNTQLKCYVVLKMIKKNLIKPKVGDSITSFHIKSTLFHCIENTPTSIWREDNLLSCITICLQRLLSYVEQRKCPNFLIPGENLFSGRINDRQYPVLQSRLSELVASEGRYVFEIECDQIGQRLLVQLCDPSAISKVVLAQNTEEIIGQSTCELFEAFDCEAVNIVSLMLEGYISDIPEFRYILRIKEKIVNFRSFHNHPDPDMEEAATDLLPFVCSTYGSLLAARCIREGNDISAESYAFLKEGMNSDLMSGTLKYASVLYCSGQFEKSVTMLEELQQKYDFFCVQPVCNCNTGRPLSKKHLFCKHVYRCSGSERRMYIARHVMFVPHEMRCCPPALYFEMFRGVGDDWSHRKWDMFWMDLTVVDAVVFMYFLLYMAYGKLGHQKRQLSSLTTLIVSIEREGPCLNHVESAYNLLGQCLEMEGKLNDALTSYQISLQLRPRNNAANWLLALNVFKQIKDNYRN